MLGWCCLNVVPCNTANDKADWLGNAPSPYLWFRWSPIWYHISTRSYQVQQRQGQGEGLDIGVEIEVDEDEDRDRCASKSSAQCTFNWNVRFTLQLAWHCRVEDFQKNNKL